MGDLTRPRLGIIGAGRAGSALARALHQRGYLIASVWSRNRAHAEELARDTGAQLASTAEEVAGQAELILLAISDDALVPFAATLAPAPRPGLALVHLSGLLPAAALRAASGFLFGALHPLQTFADRHATLPPQTTFAVEAGAPLRALLHQLVEQLEGVAVDLDPGSRPLYHAAAVFSSNYVVTLLAQAVDLLEQAGFARERCLPALLPLLRGAADALARQGLPAALTGPIARGDSGSVRTHLAALEQCDPQGAGLYRSLGLATLPLAAARGLPRECVAELEDLFDAKVAE